jgi:hypothetical protein
MSLEDLVRWYHSTYLSDMFGGMHTPMTAPQWIVQPGSTQNDTQGQLWHQFSVPNYNHAPMPHEFGVSGPQQTDGANYGDPRMSHTPALERGFNVRPGQNQQLYRDFPGDYDPDMQYR